jgi:hypothetical protein
MATVTSSSVSRSAGPASVSRSWPWSALFWTHLNLYGKFELDMSKQLDLGP